MPIYSSIYIYISIKALYSSTYGTHDVRFVQAVSVACSVYMCIYVHNDDMCTCNVLRTGTTLRLLLVKAVAGSAAS